MGRRMTEAQWLACPYSYELIEDLRETGRADSRKARLFTCALARVIWDGLAHDTHRRLIEVAEDHADGRVPFRALAAARKVAATFPERYMAEGFDGEVVCPGKVAFAAADRDAANGAWWACGDACLIPEYLPQVPGADRIDPTKLVREVFGNPFRPPAFDRRWRTADVLGLARGIYDDRAFDRLPLLADALMDAGCADEELLAHCRSAGPHVRGCWALDRALGPRTRTRRRSRPRGRR